MGTLNAALEKVKEQMTDPNPTIEENKETIVATEKKAPKKKAAAKGNGAARKATKVEGMVSLADLAKELKIEPRAARVKLRKAEVENPGRWAWKEGSGELTKVKKLLSATE